MSDLRQPTPNYSYARQLDHFIRKVIHDKSNELRAAEGLPLITEEESNAIPTIGFLDDE